MRRPSSVPQIPPPPPQPPGRGLVPKAPVPTPIVTTPATGGGPATGGSTPGSTPRQSISSLSSSNQGQPLLPGGVAPKDFKKLFDDVGKTKPWYQKKSLLLGAAYLAPMLNQSITGIADGARSATQFKTDTERLIKEYGATDANGDNIADQDMNGDGVINDKDFIGERQKDRDQNVEMAKLKRDLNTQSYLMQLEAARMRQQSSNFLAGYQGLPSYDPNIDYTAF